MTNFQLIKNHSAHKIAALVGAALVMCSCGASDKTSSIQSVSLPPTVEKIALASHLPQPTQRLEAKDARSTRNNRISPPRVSEEMPDQYRAFADQDPTNDESQKAPAQVAGCYQKLEQAGVAYYSSRLPLKNRLKGVPLCGSYDPIAYHHGPTHMSVFPHAIMDCQFALAFAEVEKLIQREAELILGQAVKRLRHLGTYNCRKMAKRNLVSEHSFANAIDIKSFILEDGTELRVADHFGPLDITDPQLLDASARFIRSVSSKVFDLNIMSVSLGPYFDHLHDDHLHLDLAHYRLDGSRPLGPLK